jgi:hypothetical protein
MRFRVVDVDVIVGLFQFVIHEPPGCRRFRMSVCSIVPVVCWSAGMSKAADVCEFNCSVICGR